MKRVYEIVFSEYPVRYSFMYPETRGYFVKYLRPSQSDEYDISASSYYIETARSLLPAGTPDGYVEYRSLVGPTSQFLLRHQCCIFHAVSFVYRNKAWLLTAPSGTGKTTQFLNWQRVFPDEIVMISGDMPALVLEKDGCISVHPSPWNGKEHLGNHVSAPLGGIVFLEKGTENRIDPFDPQEAVMPLYEQFMVMPDTEDEIRSLMRLLTGMMEGFPIIKLTNSGDDASTILLREWMVTVSC